MRREVAKRVFAEEFNECDLAFKEGNERSPRYVLLPTGERCNRLLFVGTMSEKAEIGDGMWRARVVDPTGAFTVFSGKFQEDSTAFISTAEVPSIVAVVGKIGWYEKGGETKIVIRPEEIAESDEFTRNLWIVETARRTLERIRKMESCEDEDCRKAKEHYNPDLSKYREMVRGALLFIKENQGEDFTILDLF